MSTYYDGLAEGIRSILDARAVCVIVARGSRGTGFGLDAPRSMMATLPDLLRRCADELDKVNAVHGIVKGSDEPPS